MKKSFLVIIVISLVFGSSSAFAYVMSGQSYRLQSDSINIGGVLQGSTSYRMEDTIGEVIPGYQQIAGSIFCNNNGICEPELGEDYSNCPSDCPAPTPTPPSGGGGFFPDLTPPTIYNLLISEITLNSAKISWKTNEQALCQLFWGKTQEYGKETVSETTFYFDHFTKLINLSSATNYHFKIKCRDTNRNESETVDQKFTITPLTNVSNFEAIPGDSQITLRWRNPSNPDFKAVKIMRSEGFYPKDSWEGEMVYDGKKTSFVDTALTNGKRYYYTAFSYDFAENYSSGAIASAVPQKSLPPEAPPPEIPPPPEEIPPEAPPPSEIEKITLEDFDFIQEGEKIPIIEEKIEVKSKEPLTISIDYEKVPEVLKTIMVTIEKEEKIFSFLLRVNQEKTAYLATLLSPEEIRIYPFSITVLDYENQALKRIPSQMKVIETPLPLIEIPWYKKIFNSILDWFRTMWQVIKDFFTFLLT